MAASSVVTRERCMRSRYCCMCQFEQTTMHKPAFERRRRRFNDQLWVKCGTEEWIWNAEGKIKNEKCGTTVIGPQVRPRDRSYYAVYRTPCKAGAAINCVMRMWKCFVHVTVILICHLLQSVFNWKVLRNDINKSYCCVWHCCRYPQGLQSIIHHAKHVSVPVISRCSVKNGWMHNWASFWHRSFLSPVLHCVQKKFRICSKIMVLPSGTLSQTPDIENFALACQSVRLVISLAQQSGRS